jgi:hypothetical protein
MIEKIEFTKGGTDREERTESAGAAGRKVRPGEID